jgi:hypothetical protein
MKSLYESLDRIDGMWAAANYLVKKRPNKYKLWMNSPRDFILFERAVHLDWAGKPSLRWRKFVNSTIRGLDNVDAD